MTIKVDPAFILRCFLISIFILLCLNTIVLFYLYNYETSSASMRVIDWFSFDREANIPSFYSAVNLCFASILLFLASALNKKAGNQYQGWLGLGAVFLFLAFDEAASLHEALTGITQRTLNTSGFLQNAWFIPYAIVLILGGIVYVPFLKNLPRRTLRLFVFSGVIFVTGAIGFEMLGGEILERQGHSALYAFTYTCEETLEMVGIALFIYGILDYLEKSFDPRIGIGKN